MDVNFDGSKINSPDYWNKRFFEDWIAKGGRKQTAFFAELCCRELPDWFLDEGRARKSGIFDYGCALGDALPVLQRAFPDSPIRGGDVAQVGLGLARALHPGFEFVDVNAIGEASKIGDIVYCSNTLEHFENWREILHGLSRHAKEYVLVVVPFEEEDRIDEHCCTFEFDSLPARLPSGARLMHLGVCNAGLEPDTQWNGWQLIAIYGKARRGRDQPGRYRDHAMDRCFSTCGVSTRRPSRHCSPASPRCRRQSGGPARRSSKPVDRGPRNTPGWPAAWKMPSAGCSIV